MDVYIALFYECFSCLHIVCCVLSQKSRITKQHYQFYTFTLRVGTDAKF